jgi:Domain of unknown function (DUF4258)
MVIRGDMPPPKEDTPPQPWKSGRATELIRELAASKFELVRTKHAREQLKERELVVGDVLHLLKNGYVYDEPEASTRPGFYKYCMECSTPNSHPRTLRVIVVPSVSERILKIITVMWRDEASHRGG